MAATANDHVDPVRLAPGGLVVLSTRGRTMGVPAIMTDCRFERLEGRLFLVGVNQPCRANQFEWTNGTTRRVAWDVVDEYVVFDSLNTNLVPNWTTSTVNQVYLWDASSHAVSAVSVAYSGGGPKYPVY